MPRYLYDAQDRAGKPVSGTLDAPDANAVVQQLGARGLMVMRLAPEGRAPSAGIGSIQQTSVPQPASVARSRVQASSAIKPDHSAIARDQQQYFILLRLYQLFKAGIAPGSAMEELAKTEANPKLKRAFIQVAQRTSEGGGLAAAMAEFPYVFPREVRGSVAVGEASGRLPEVVQSAANTVKSRLVWRWILFGAVFLLAPMVLLFPLILGLVRGLEDVFKMEGNGDGLAVLGQGLARSAFGPMGLLFVLLAGGFLGAVFLIRHPRSRPFRHRMGHRYFRKRSRAEGLASFTWHLEQLTEVGIPAYQAWPMAAEAVPSDVIAGSLRMEAAVLRENVKLSDLAARSNLIPVEYRSLIQTGEVSGSVPEVLNQAAKLADKEAQTQGYWVGAKAGCWVMLVSTLLAGLAAALFFRGYADAMFKGILGP